MNAGSTAVWQQRIKWTLYALLFVDFFLYVAQDAESAAHTLPAHPGLLEWARAYVTSIDVAAWLVLILCFELETYVLPRHAWKGGIEWAVQGVRLVCCITILHTTYVDAGALTDFRGTRALPWMDDLCTHADGRWSFLENREYTRIDAANCADLGVGPTYFVVGPDPVLTDRSGLREGLVLAWTDLIENVAWLLIVFCNEIVIRIQERGIGSGALLTLSTYLKAALYAVIVTVALYWGSKDQILYLWDELLWVGGFLAIEKNIQDWRAGLFRKPRPAVLANGT